MCVTLTQYTLDCNRKNRAGSSKLWLVAAKDLINIGETLSPYTLSTEGEVSAIGLAEDVTFVEIGILKNAVSIVQNYTYNQENGVTDFADTLTLNVSGIKTSAKKFLNEITQAPVAALVQLKSGKFIVMGLDGDLEVTGVVSTNDATNNGHVITFTGASNDFIPEVVSTLIPTIIG